MKQKTVYVCNECGYECPKWLGKCPSCGEWNTLQEQAPAPAPAKTGIGSATSSGHAVKLNSVSAETAPRLSTGIKELDGVLGGGLVPASLVLCGGDPGIGKSTLLLQAAQALCASGTVMYVSAEESAHQVKLRADRLGVSSENLMLLCETELSSILYEIERIHPVAAVIDSVQTIIAGDLTGVQGSVSQVRECTARIMRFAKSTGIAILLVGHVTKEGAIAGPKVLEHLVDTVLYFEGEQNGAFRILRAVKNRFGSSNEIAIFEMSDAGMLPVDDPSSHLLSGNTATPGSAVMCVLEGNRPLLCEVQALTAHSAFVSPRRSGNGIDYNRLAMLLAVLEKKLGFTLYDQDVYVNVAGGLKITEPAADLAALAAIASAIRNTEIPHGTVLIGEVGLTGELRGVSQCARRAAECVKLGFDRLIVPKSCKKDLRNTANIDIIYCDSLYAALKSCLG